MSIPEFKPSKSLLGIVRRSCLKAEFKHRDIPTLGRRHSRKAADKVCRVYLCGGRGEITAWQETWLKRLFENGELVSGIEVAMREYESSPGYSGEAKEDVEDIQREGLLPYLLLEAIVIDDASQEILLLIGTEKLVNLMEHGITIYWKRERWQFEYGDYVTDFLRRTTSDAQTGSAEKQEGELSESLLFGKWVVDEEETAKELRASGASKAQLKEGLLALNGLTYEFHEGTMRIIDNSEEIVADLVGLFPRQQRFMIDVRFPGQDKPETWELGYRNGKLIFDAWIMRRET